MSVSDNKLKDNPNKKVVDANVQKEKPKKTSTPKTPKKVKPVPRKEHKKFADTLFVKILGGFVIFLGVYLTLAFLSYLVDYFNRIGNHMNPLPDTILAIQGITGKVGTLISSFFIKGAFGIGSVFVLVLCFYAGIRMLFKYKILNNWNVWKYSLISFVWIPIFFGLIFPSDPYSIFGGTIGLWLNDFLKGYIGTAGIIIALSFLFLIYIVLTFKLTFNFAKKNEKSEEKDAFRVADQKTDQYNVEEFAVKENEEVEFIIDGTNKLKPNKPKATDNVVLEVENTEKVETSEEGHPEEENVVAEKTEQEKQIELSVEPTKTEEIVVEKGPVEHYGLDTEFDPTLELRDYRFPTIDLLKDYDTGNTGVQTAELEANKNRIVDTLNNYAIGIDKIKATIGPTVTLYEIVPAAGVRISRIKNLEDDIALSLSAIGIRIIAPIPGKGTVGIEVPNQNPEIVSMRSILASEKFKNSKYELPFGIGKTISNESFVADLTKMPHILMAGATGQGKSVGLNAIIASLLYCKHPAELKFVMVDPKKVELSLFSKIERHFLAKLPDSEEAIITDTRKVVRTLNSLCIEMDNRYELLKDAQVRNIKEYNAKFKDRKLNPLQGHHFLPYFVLVVDEFADLIMTAGKEIESPITRLAQLARAVGIHLIIATQRPSVNIITGTIKANFPARIAFRVISRVDSRTILDASGADQLVGRGDMLLSTGNDMVRLQCAFIDTPEVEALTDFIGSQRGYPDAYHLPEFAEEQDEPQESYDASERDSLFEDAARIIVQTQQGSTSLLQRKLKLGYNRAGRIIDQLEAAGIVGPFEGSKAREVRVANEVALEQFLKDLDSRSKSDF